MTNRLSSGRINSIQGIRAIAILGICITHSGFSIDFGGFGVVVFFVLSGFVMSYVYYDRNIECNNPFDNLKFSLNKIKRLYPLHIVTMFFAILFEIIVLFAGISNLSILELIRNIVLNSLLIHTWFPNQSIYFCLNGVSWYLSVTLFLYFVFPIIINIIRKHEKLFAWISSVLIFALIGVVSIISKKYIDNEMLRIWMNYVCPLVRLGAFSIGCNFGFIFLKRNKELSSPVTTVLEILSLIIVVVVLCLINIENKSMLIRIFTESGFISIPISVLLIYVIATQKGIVSKLLSTKPFVFIGNMSSYIFLTHQIIMRFIDTGLKVITGNSPQWYITALLGGVITTMFIFVYRKIEKVLFSPKEKEL